MKRVLSVIVMMIALSGLAYASPGLQNSAAGSLAAQPRVSSVFFVTLEKPNFLNVDRGDRPFDRDLDRIGRAISFEQVDVSKSRVESQLKDLAARLQNARGLALPFELLQTSTAVRSLAKEFQASGRFVYIYGNGVTPAGVGDLLEVNVTGLKEQPDPEDLNKRATLQISTGPYSVVGVASTGAAMAIRTAETDNADPVVLHEDSLRSIVRWELDRQNPVADSGVISIMSEDIVKSWVNHSKTWYIQEGDSSTAVVGNILVDWYLHKDTSETDPNLDYFAIDPRYEITDGNNICGSGWALDWFQATHEMSAYDELRDWDPRSATSSRFVVSLSLAGPTVGWNFDMNQNHTLTTTASQASDIVTYRFDNPWYNLQPDVPLHVRPGTSWASSGTVMALYTYHQVGFTYPMLSVTKTWNDPLYWDY